MYLSIKNISVYKSHRVKGRMLEDTEGVQINLKLNLQVLVSHAKIYLFP